MAKNNVKFGSMKSNSSYYNVDATIATLPASQENKFFDFECPDGETRRFFVKEWNGTGYEIVPTEAGEKYDFVMRLGISKQVCGNVAIANKLFSAFANGDTKSLDDIELNAICEMKCECVIWKHKEPKKF